MSILTRALSTALVDFLWQGALVGALLWLALVALRRRSPTVRYAVSCLALATLMVLPLLTMATLWSWTAVDPVAAADAAASPATTAMPQTMLPIWLVSDSPRIVWLEVVQLWALPIWSFGVLMLSIRLVWAYRHSFTVRRGEPCADAHVLATVAGLAQQIGITKPVRVVISSLTSGPGVVGWLRPVMLLPPAAALGLTPQQLEAVIAHELAHIKRHDYLVNLFQVVAETVFFYHPVVWWTSKQIRIERELCCDDVAVRANGDPIAYARALTTLARHQLGAPALTMAATGGSLLHRVQRLVGGATHEYTSARAPGLIVASLAIACVMLNLDWLQAFDEAQPPQQLRFDVASIKTNRLNDGLVTLSGQGGRFTARGMSLRSLIQYAYQVQEFQIDGAPEWLNAERFDITATMPEGVAPAPTPGVPTPQQLMLRTLLEERFGLAVHKETKQRPVYALVLARSDGRLGPEMRPSTTDCSDAAARGRGPTATTGLWQGNPCGTSVGPGVILGGNRTMAQIATAFSTLTNTGSSLNRLVVDRTGLAGTYDIALRFTPDNIPSSGGGPAGPPPIDPNGPSIFTAVQEQLGLKLESQQGPVEVLVIDRVQRPTED
jgi:uncharacterized protein (TIGR03435 family)